jgi:FAD/FMN-containing dehydrogenase
VPLAGWGRYPVADCRVVEPDTVEELGLFLGMYPSAAIARGNGRSYGDSSLSPECTIATTRLGRFLHFDPGTGALVCEGGTLLSDVIDTFLPRGWFPPVTPGTKFVTIGGMIASDVHGKNHHRAGSFCEHVSSIELATSEGTVLTCSPTENADLFAATCGGMGLTGIIVRATIRLIAVASSRIEQTILRAPNLSAAMDIFDERLDSTYSVAWIDCVASGATLGRCIVILGEHASAEKLHSRDRESPYARMPRAARRLPFDLPAFFLNGLSVRVFNSLYYRLNRPGASIVDIDTYFYPLDGMHDWNRMYGRRGFVQYQCVLPLTASRSGIAELLTHIARAGLGSFLGVLKRLGKQSFGHLSFPTEGYTLALDFPLRPDTLRLLDTLDRIVAAHCGRIYLTKDARAPASLIASGYPRLAAFRDVRGRFGLHERFQSLQSRRLEL